MTFLLDENFPKAAAGLLLELGHHGILVVALKRPTRQLILERLEWLLSEIKDERRNISKGTYKIS